MSRGTPRANERTPIAELPEPDFRSIFNALPGLYLILRPNDPVFTIVAANREYADATLTHIQEIAGRGVFEVFPENPNEGNASGVRNLRESFRQVLATRRKHAMALQRYDIPAPNGHGFEERYWSPVNSPLLGQDGEVQYLIHRVEDVTDLVRRGETEEAAANSAALANPMETELILRARQFAEAQTLFRERQEMEQRLRAIEARYSLAFAKAPIGMVLLTPEGEIRDVNQAYLKNLGYTREELTSQDSSRFTHPEDVQLTREFFAMLRRGDRDTGSIEKRYFSKDGRIVWSRASATMRRDDDGNPVEVIAIVEDITERKRAQEQLWESQAQLRAIYDTTREYIGLLAPDGTLLNCNSASLEFAGSTLDDVKGMPYWHAPWFAFTPGAAECIREAIARGARGEFVRHEIAITRPSGELMTFDFSLHPVRNQRGEVVFLVPEARDITEQHRASRQIEEDRARWRELLRQTPAAIALLQGPDHKFEWVNPGYESLVGRSADELVGKFVSEAIPEVDRLYIEMLDKVYRTGEPFTGHESPISLDRGGVMTDLFMNFVFLPTRDTAGAIDGIFAHVTDVTDTVLARKQIEESERQFRTLAETIPHLAWMADGAGNRIWFNRRWYEYTGTTWNEASGWGWQKTHDPAVLGEVLQRWEDALSSGDALEMVYPIRGADGSFRSFLTRVEPVKDINGRVVRWFGTNTDITVQRNTEEELRRMNRELEEFAFVASHDLQEPLRMVNIYTQKILRNPQAGKETLDLYSGFVKEGVKRMELLIHDLLNFSRTVNVREVTTGRAELSAALTEALSILKARIDESHAVISAPPLPAVMGETSQLTHVFQNVLSNALKYRRRGVAPRIDITAERAGARWVVAIRDNGIGFEQQYAERIFGLFKRLHKDEYPGTGIGLAICRRIVERYSGRMWAEGKPGGGATIYFSLTAAEDE